MGIQQMMMSSAKTDKILLTNQSYLAASASQGPTVTSTAYYTVANTGIVSLWGGVTEVQPSDEWCPGVTASDYEALTSNILGPINGSANNTWLNLGTTRGWFVSRTGNGTTTGEFDISIRKVGTTVVLATARITLQAAVGIIG